jgi:phosphomethylpyrimidine synthase
MCGRYFSSMNITEDKRKYAAEQRVKENEVVGRGLREKATEFVKTGSDLYSKI